jgi:hypothetical protein
MGDKQYIFLPAVFKRIFFFFLLLFPILSQAQDEQKVVDSVRIAIEEKVDQDQQPPDAVKDEKKVDYFLKKWKFASHSFLVQQRRVPDSLVKKMQQDDDFWYANADIKNEKKQPEKESRYIPLGQQQWFQVLLWIVIVGGFAAGLMWFLAGSNIGLFRKRNEEIRDDMNDELDTEDIFAINYQKEIDKAASQGNYRLAIRLMFLRLLRDMAEKNIIQYKQDKTNFDYLLQLQPTIYYNHFFRITRNYEYSWYGQFEVNEETYQAIRSDFDKLDRQLR